MIAYWVAIDRYCLHSLHPEGVGRGADTVLSIHVGHLHHQDGAILKQCEVLAEHDIHAGVSQGGLTHLTQVEPRLIFVGERVEV